MTEGKQITDRNDIERFVHGGKATFTLVSKASGARYTYKVNQMEDQPGKYFVKVMWGSDNERSYKYMGMIASGAFFRTQKSKVSDKDIRYMSFDWFYRNLMKGSEKLEQVEFWHEGKCACCGRKLTVPASIQTGVGPECAKRFK